jgi:hypothetical protein
VYVYGDYGKCLNKLDYQNYLQYMTNFTEGLMEEEKYPIERRQRACRYGTELDHRVSTRPQKRSEASDGLCPCLR